MCVHLKENPRRSLNKRFAYRSINYIWMSLMAIKKEKLQGGIGFFFAPPTPKNPSYYSR